jgi:hypothetical protein
VPKADIVKIGNDQLVLFLERVECLPKWRRAPVLTERLAWAHTEFHALLRIGR